MQKRIILYQILTVVILAGLGLIFGITIAITALIGAAISAVPTIVLALWFFWQNPLVEPAILMRRFYIAELLKVVFAVTLLTIVLRFLQDVNTMLLIIAYLITQLIPTSLAFLQDDGNQ